MHQKNATPKTAAIRLVQFMSSVVHGKSAGSSLPQYSLDAGGSTKRARAGLERLLAKYLLRHTIFKLRCCLRLGCLPDKMRRAVRMCRTTWNDPQFRTTGASRCKKIRASFGQIYRQHSTMKSLRQRARFSITGGAAPHREIYSRNHTALKCGIICSCAREIKNFGLRCSRAVNLPAAIKVWRRFQKTPLSRPMREDFTPARMTRANFIFQREVCRR